VKVIENVTIRQTGYGFLLVFCSNFVPMKYSTSEMPWPWKPGYTSVKVIDNVWPSHSRSAHMTSYWRSIVIMARISCRFWDIQCRKISWPWNPDQRSLKVIDSGTIRKNEYGFLLVFCSNFVPKMHRFWDIRLAINYIVTLKPGLGVTQGQRNRQESIHCLWLPINVP